MTSAPIRIIRGEGGEVEVEGPYDKFAAQILAHAGFLTFPTLRGQWVRLSFDLGRAWENEHASWAAEMLSAARYQVHLDPDLRISRPGQCAPSAPKHRPAMTAQAAPAERRTRH
ncbi:hypothetical protein CTU88_14245 [Streptomyces sp. JV178]|uniref:hypothetical protein n=1 Tax=Streptomyces sp. JV178 TaxID=858632 RepID=UPI000C1B3302|nr:hypothetical protein [Streptomyces sp. JV178]PIM71282.1 hypothetical protein CTU88_14245 [Streptomyces sp. JV178]